MRPTGTIALYLSLAGGLLALTASCGSSGKGPQPGTVCSEPTDCTDPGLPVCVDQTCSECGTDTDCAAGAPVCNDMSHACEGCQGRADCARFVDRTLCDDNGACVGCRVAVDCADPSAPVCDPDSKMCRACAAGSECASNVCALDSGTCITEGDILYVEVGGTGTSCTRSDPCGTITAALGKVSGTKQWIHVSGGTYAENLTISAGSPVRIVGEERARLTSRGVGPVIDVQDGADLAIYDLIVDGGDPGIQCTNSGQVPKVAVFNAVIGPSAGAGIYATGCTVTVTRSTLSGNDGGGLSIINGTFTIINNFIVGNGKPDPSGSTVGGVDASGMAGSRFEHNTVSGNHATASVNPGVHCLGTLPLQNDIIYGNGAATDDQVNANCTYTFSLIGPKVVTGDGNISGPPTFVDSSVGNFHLKAGSPGIDAAADSDVKVDFDGDTRPQGPASDIGADEVVP